MSFSKYKLNFIFKNYYHIIILGFISILSFTLNFYNISSYGYGNEYYAAAIESMTQSFKNFFFVSFDPSGMVSIDKPPIGFWIQTIFVLIFGYNGFAMLLPQALCSTASCLMLYIILSKYLGRNHGLLASFILAFTPALVVASRNNTVDTQLIFVLLLSAYFLLKSIETSKLKYLLAAGILVGIGFNIKMLQAYMAVPSFAIVYLIFSTHKLSKKFIHGIITSILMISISLSWALIVDLYPSDERPYVGSSSNNSEIELILGHNGMERILGNSSSKNSKSSLSDKNGINTLSSPQSHNNKSSNSNNNKSNKNAEKNVSLNTQNNKYENNSGGRDNIGEPSILRLWNHELYGQISWLLIFCIFTIITLIRKYNKKDLNMKNAVICLWSTWFIIIGLFFSFAGYFHKYYLCMMSPAIAALFSFGFINMFKYLKLTHGLKKYILPTGLILTGFIQFRYVYNYENLRIIFCPIIIISLIIGLIFMIYINKRFIFRYGSALLLMLSLFLSPFYWSYTTVEYIPPFTKPYAGPELASNNNSKSIPSAYNESSSLQNYLVSNYKEGSFLLVANKSSDVSQYIIDTGLPCYAYGGFMGSDNSLSLNKLKQYVEEGKITYFLVSDNNTKSSSSEIINYVKENGTLIDPSEYGSKSSKGSLYKL